MLKDVLRSMDLAVAPIVTLLLFLGIFAIMLFLTLRRRPAEDAHALSLPLDDGERDGRTLR